MSVCLNEMGVCSNCEGARAEGEDDNTFANAGGAAPESVVAEVNHRSAALLDETPHRSPATHRAGKTTNLLTNARAGKTTNSSKTSTPELPSVAQLKSQREATKKQRLAAAAAKKAAEKQVAMDYWARCHQTATYDLDKITTMYSKAQPGALVETELKLLLADYVEASELFLDQAFGRFKQDWSALMSDADMETAENTAVPVCPPPIKGC